MDVSDIITCRVIIKMKNHRHAVGDEIAIVAGVYKKCGRGTYLGPAGLISASIRVIGDTKDKRSLRLSSIKPVMKSVDDDEAVMLTKEEHVSLLEEISHLSDSLQQLQLKVEKIGK